LPFHHQNDVGGSGCTIAIDIGLAQQRWVSACVTRNRLDYG
jgi:hypothetical protein